eukprot:366425-Chlamydomonas_euryale.AAC.2
MPVLLRMLSAAPHMLRKHIHSRGPPPAPACSPAADEHMLLWGLQLMCEAVFCQFVLGNLPNLHDSRKLLPPRKYVSHGCKPPRSAPKCVLLLGHPKTKTGRLQLL